MNPKSDSPARGMIINSSWRGHWRFCGWLNTTSLAAKLKLEPELELYGATLYATQ
jgi:hypothetical protein